jgi:hypothetical protein
MYPAPMVHLVLAIKPKAKFKFRVAATLLLKFYKKIDLDESWYFSRIRYHTTLQGLRFSESILDPTSELRMVAMFMLLVV